MSERERINFWKCCIFDNPVRDKTSRELVGEKVIAILDVLRLHREGRIDGEMVEQKIRNINTEVYCD